jgi:hypothetical protein
VHTLADRIGVFAGKRENVGQEGFNALVRRVPPDAACRTAPCSFSLSASRHQVCGSSAWGEAASSRLKALGGARGLADASHRAARSLQVGQLGNTGGDPPGFVAGEQPGRGASGRLLLAGDAGQRLPLASRTMKHRRSSLGSASSTDQGGGGKGRGVGPDTLKHLTRCAKLCRTSAGSFKDANLRTAPRSRVRTKRRGRALAASPETCWSECRPVPRSPLNPKTGQSNFSPELHCW